MENSVTKKSRMTTKASNSIPAFLLKTYEILDVIFHFAITV